MATTTNKEGATKPYVKETEKQKEHVVDTNTSIWPDKSELQHAQTNKLPTRPTDEILRAAAYRLLYEQNSNQTVCMDIHSAMDKEERAELRQDIMKKWPMADMLTEIENYDLFPPSSFEYTIIRVLWSLVFPGKSARVKEMDGRHENPLTRLEGQVFPMTPSNWKRDE